LLPQYCPITSRHSSSSILSPRNFTSFGPTDASSTHLRQGEPRLVPHLSLNLDITSTNNSQSKPIATMTDLAKPQKIELESNHFRFNDDLVVTFQRTIRVPDNQQTSKLPPSLGAFPLKAVSGYADKPTSAMSAKGGLFFPMYRTYQLFTWKFSEDLDHISSY
jgi:hypothetical protein